ncbi:MAG: hypothetical protein WCJ56_11670, partial [bacterium]
KGQRASTLFAEAMVIIILHAAMCTYSHWMSPDCMVESAGQIVNHSTKIPHPTVIIIVTIASRLYNT